MSRFDEDIRGQFADLRAEDAARSPEFRPLWTVAQRRAPAVSLRPSIMRRAWLLSAAAILVVAAGLVVWRVERLRAPDEAAAGNAGRYPSITTWIAPTNALLSMSNATTNISSPLLGSALGGVVLPPVPR